MKHMAWRKADHVDALHHISASHVAIEAEQSTGSGTVVSCHRQNSYVLTCHHVLREQKRCEVLFRLPERKDLQRVNAVVECVDEENDLALVRTARRVLVPLGIAQEEPEVYERLYAMGAPDGLYGTAADAILTSKNRFNGQDDRYQYTGLTVPGMSGGSLCNLDGELVGVISNVKTDAHLPVWNIGFAVTLPKINGFLAGLLP